MDALTELSWRAYPGGVLLALGVAMLARGLMTTAVSWRMSIRDRERPVVFVSGFRVGIVGLAIAGLAGAWIWQQVWLLALALAIGGEELLETSTILYVLRWGRRQEAVHARRRAATAS